jgi:hypothetical protein
MPYFSRAWLSLEVSLPLAELAAQLPVAPTQLAERLAAAVDAYTTQAGIGYYPALTHVREQGGIDSDLWALVECTAEWVDSQTRYRLRRVLAAFYSSLEIEQLQPRAYALPKVRPRQQDAQTQLIHHLTLDTLHGVLRLSHISRQPPDSQALSGFIAQQVRHHLKSSFAAITILSVTVEPLP